MAMYTEEEEVWKCPKHPSKRRRNGICPTCLRDRLITLCPDCANVRPCACCPATSSSSSSSSSSSFSFFSSASSSRRGGRVADLIDREPGFRRSRSVGVPFLFTRFAREKQAEENSNSPMRKKSRTASFLSRFLWNRSKKGQEAGEEQNEENSKVTNNLNNNNNTNEENECRNSCSSANIEEFANMMMRSRSVSTAKGKAWSFSSPMKVFRQTSKTPKVANDRSPMCRG